MDESATQSLYDKNVNHLESIGAKKQRQANVCIRIYEPALAASSGIHARVLPAFDTASVFPKHLLIRSNNWIR
jgi:hypothetical protein